MYIMLFFIGLAIALAAYVLIIHDKVMHQKQIATENWAYIEVYLKKRVGYIGHLFQTAQGALQHEQVVMASLNKIRNHLRRHGHDVNHLKEYIDIEFELEDTLNLVLSSAEKYADLQKNEAFLQIKKALSTLTTELGEKAKLYNSAATIINKYLSTFPSKTILSFFEIDTYPLFEKTVLKEQVP